MTRKTAGYVAIDKQGVAIQGVGTTADAAILDALTNCGPLHDADGNPRSHREAREQFRTLPATGALLRKVDIEGGAIDWDETDDIADVDPMECMQAFAEKMEGEQLADLIREKFNCAEAEVDGDGDVWIAEPQTGHWLDTRKLIELVDWIEDKQDAEKIA